MIACSDTVALPVCDAKQTASDISVTDVTSGLFFCIRNEPAIFHVAQEIAGVSV
jgi:hypothetical protein